MRPGLELGLSSARPGAAAHHVREVLRILHADSQQLDVEELVDRVQGAADRQVCGAGDRRSCMRYGTVCCCEASRSAPFFNSTTISLPTRVLKKE